MKQMNRKQILSNVFIEYIRLYPIQLLVEVKPITVYDRNDISSIHDTFVEIYKCEGIILRNFEGTYEPNKRSSFLQKYKKFMDSEYKIVGFTQADGRDIGTVIWICEYLNKSGTPSTFNVRPIGTLEYRKSLYENGNEYVGKMLTVKYQELTDELCPRFPVGKCIRDYE
jgi:DNA ligase-1